MLYVIPTPIGHLGDISPRALEILNSVDVIICEDTRHSAILLNHYKISKPLVSYHKFNEVERSEKLIGEMKKGKTMALISDAGTPGISDPGAFLVSLCHQNGIKVIPLPGPCAMTTALSASGFTLDRFQFIGFFPRKEQELKQVLLDAIGYNGVTIGYESPKRLLDTLDLLTSLAPQIMVCAAKELTKVYEEIVIRSASEQLDYWKAKCPLKGEFVVLISSSSTNQENPWHAFSPLEHVAFLERQYDLSRKEAIKLAAELRGVPKRDVYQQIIFK